MMLNDIVHSRYDNYVKLTIFALVILPLLLLFSNIFIKIYYIDIYTFFIAYSNNGYLGFQIAFLFQYFVFAVLLVLYPLSSFVYSMEKYFRKRNPQSIIVEEEIIKKIVYILIPFFVFAIAFILIPRITEENILISLISFFDNPILLSLFSTTMGVVFLIVGSVLLKIILLEARKDFRYYFARTLLNLISKQEEQTDRMRYFVKGLKSYNKYIRRTLGIQINNLKIYSKIVSDPTIDTNNTIQELSTAFEDIDKFKPIKSLYKILKVTDFEKFIIEESIGKKIQDSIGIVGTIVSTVTAIIGALTTLIL